MAEREGFEPPEPFPVQWFSRPPPSTTRPPLRTDAILTIQALAAARQSYDRCAVFTAQRGCAKPVGAAGQRYTPDPRMKAFVTGAAGFIGSTLVDRLLADGHDVVGYDNFSTGHEVFLAEACRSPSFRLVRGDTLDDRQLAEAMAGASIVFHLAANADVRFGTDHPRKDLEQNTIATFNVLEAMRANGVRSDRLCLHGIDLRRGGGDPHAGGRRRFLSRPRCTARRSWRARG